VRRVQRSLRIAQAEVGLRHSFASCSVMTGRGADVLSNRNSASAASRRAVVLTMRRLYERTPSYLDFLCKPPHLVSVRYPFVEAKMAVLAGGDDDCCRSAFEDRTSSYRIDRVQTKHGRGRSASNRANGYLKSMIDKIADAKVRRMRRERELPGIHFAPESGNWVAHSQRARIGGAWRLFGG
jgi:hypothetical protein